MFAITVQPETVPDLEGWYNASVPPLPGCFSCAATREETLHGIKEAIDLHFEDLEGAGEPVPDEPIESIELGVWCLGSLGYGPASWFEPWKSAGSCSPPVRVATEYSIMARRERVLSFLTTAVVPCPQAPSPTFSLKPTQVQRFLHSHQPRDQSQEQGQNGN